MSASAIEIRRLRAADGAAYREIRLEALSLSPEAFGSAFETESVHPVGWFARRLEGEQHSARGFFIGALRNDFTLATGCAVGIAGVDDDGAHSALGFAEIFFRQHNRSRDN